MNSRSDAVLLLSVQCMLHRDLLILTVFQLRLGHSEVNDIYCTYIYKLTNLNISRLIPKFQHLGKFQMCKNKCPIETNICLFIIIINIP